mmetsp:Transcript_53827/g.173882  ORF Transcript_53827/g.173882 Transcript_53827/m.173882 type:complete len:433 (-) Transcript_53827:194-1492(-)
MLRRERAKPSHILHLEGLLHEPRGLRIIDRALRGHGVDPVEAQSLHEEPAVSVDTRRVVLHDARLVGQKDEVQQIAARETGDDAVVRVEVLRQLIHGDVFQVVPDLKTHGFELVLEFVGACNPPAVAGTMSPREEHPGGGRVLLAVGRLNAFHKASPELLLHQFLDVGVTARDLAHEHGLVRLSRGLLQQADPQLIEDGFRVLAVVAPSAGGHHCRNLVVACPGALQDRSHARQDIRKSMGKVEALPEVDVEHKMLRVCVCLCLLLGHAVAGPAKPEGRLNSSSSPIQALQHGARIGRDHDHTVLTDVLAMRVVDLSELVAVGRLDAVEVRLHAPWGTRECDQAILVLQGLSNALVESFQIVCGLELELFLESRTDALWRCQVRHQMGIHIRELARDAQPTLPRFDQKVFLARAPDAQLRLHQRGCVSLGIA